MTFSRRHYELIARTLKEGEAVSGQPVTHISIQRNGDPYGRGFTGTRQAGRHARFGIYCGNIGAQSRAWWRRYARTHGYKLIEE